MLAPVARSDYLRFVSRVPPRDPTARGVEERKRRRSVFVSSVLASLGYLSPCMTCVLCMNDNEIACALCPWRRVAVANRPRFTPANKLNPTKLRSRLATDAFTFAPSKREWHDRIWLALPEAN
jgi:hypothetical protein